MKLKAILLLAIAACDPTPDIDQTWQEICNPNPDTCPGGHPITPKQFTINDAKRLAPLLGYPTVVQNASCNAISCRASVGTEYQQFVATCYDFTAVAWCDHQTCSRETDSDGNDSWVCNDTPPLE